MTWLPKGVACSHANVVFRLPPDAEGGRRPISFLHAFPIGTNAGQEVLRVPLRRGNSTGYTLARFDPDRFCAIIAAHRVRRLQVVPAMAQMILASGAHTRHDISSVERITIATCGSCSAPRGRRSSRLGRLPRLTGLRLRYRPSSSSRTTG